MKIGTDTSGYRALRGHRYSTPNQVYLITFTVDKRQRIFVENHLAARAFCLSLNDSRLWYEARLMCWELMPDHVHLLIQIGEIESLSRLVGRVKTNTARVVNRVLKKKGQLWEKGFHDKAIRSEENIVDIARYIALNPIRVGLVKNVGMYPYWDAIWL